MISANARRILTFIAMRLKWQGVAPTYHEIAEAVHLSITTVYWHVQQLQTAGLIEHEHYRTRSFRLSA